MKNKVSSLSVLKEILHIFPDEVVYIISKYHGRWIKLTVPTRIKVKVREPRDKRCKKKHLISHHYI